MAVALLNPRPQAFATRARKPAYSTLAYTGVGVTVPARTACAFVARATYNNAEPQQLVVSTSATQTTTASTVALGHKPSGVASSISCAGVWCNESDAPAALCVWERCGWDSTAGNDVSIGGVMLPL